MLRYNDFKEKPREFLAATGLTGAEFQCLLPSFEQAYQQLLQPNQNRRKRTSNELQAAADADVWHR